MTIFPIYSYAQENNIDSTFSFYFKVVDTYLSDTLSPSRNPDFFEVVHVDTLSSDTIYKNKYIDDAVAFLQEISNIYPPKKHSFYMTYIVDRATLDLWKNWYYSNRKKLYWNKRKNKIQIRNK